MHPQKINNKMQNEKTGSGRGGLPAQLAAQRTGAPKGRGGLLANLQQGSAAPSTVSAAPSVTEEPRPSAPTAPTQSGGRDENYLSRRFAELNIKKKVENHGSAGNP
jgi:hypothetical protein